MHYTAHLSTILLNRVVFCSSRCHGPGESHAIGHPEWPRGCPQCASAHGCITQRQPHSRTHAAEVQPKTRERHPQAASRFWHCTEGEQASLDPLPTQP